MTKKYFLALALLCALPLLGELPQGGITLVAFSAYEGDARGDFVGDIVVHFEDGTAWKVHPKDQHEIGSWEIGDVVHVEPRIANYLFKREHHFMLYNESKQKKRLRTMRVDHGELYPLTIDEVSEVYVQRSYWDYESVPGAPIIIPVKKKIKRKDVRLSDGNVYVIQEEFEAFQPGQLAYIGIVYYPLSNKQLEFKSQGKCYFLSAGIEREGRGSWFYSKEEPRFLTPN